MKNSFSLRDFLCAWGLLSFVIGILLTFVEWGNLERFHGTGIPFAQVYWDRDRATGRMLDYPNPYAMALNPAAVFLAGAALILLVR